MLSAAVIVAGAAVAVGFYYYINNKDFSFFSSLSSLTHPQKQFEASLKTIPIPPLLNAEGEECSESVSKLIAQVEEIFKTPVEHWTRVIVDASKVLSKVTHHDKVNLDTIRIYIYPLAATSNNNGLPIFLYEWDWEDCTPETAVENIRNYYFDEQYIDDESDISLIEKPKLSFTCKGASAAVAHAVWRPRTGFTTRDWVQLVCYDKTNNTVADCSCLHSAAPPKATNSLTSKILNWIPGYSGKDWIRAKAFMAIRCEKPRDGKSGCLLRQVAWNSMEGLPDMLGRTFSFIFKEYEEGVMRQFNTMVTYAKDGAPTEPKFSL